MASLNLFRKNGLKNQGNTLQILVTTSARDVEQMKIRFLIIIIVIIAFVLISFAMPDLSKVYDSCEMAQSGTLQLAIGYHGPTASLHR